MNIKLPRSKDWNDNRLTIIEEPSIMGDVVMVCLHKPGDEPETGETVKVWKSDLIRAANMIAQPHVDDTNS